MSRGQSILEWVYAGFAALVVICVLPGCERTISDEDFVPAGETPEPTAAATPTPIPDVESMP